DIRLAMTAAIRKYLVENPSGFDPRAYLKVARAAAKDLCIKRYLAFGCEGQASRIKPISLSVMAAHYADGTLRQNVR
ncbi:fructose-1,6-bisphosphate aldolase, partial [gut metagenome]